MEEKEVTHIIEVLQNVKNAINDEDSVKLMELSNQTIHAASTIQDAGSITLAVLVYTISKMMGRGDHKKIKNGSPFLKKFVSWIDLGIKALRDEKYSAYEKYLESARKSLTSASINYKKYIEDVLRKSSINKASRIYEHGISLGRTAKLLGITQWELFEYAGQKSYNTYQEAISVRKRVSMAMEFFS